MSRDLWFPHILGKFRICCSDTACFLARARLSNFNLAHHRGGCTYHFPILFKQRRPIPRVFEWRIGRAAMDKVFVRTLDDNMGWLFISGKSPRRPLWVINLSLASEGGGDICDKRRRRREIWLCWREERELGWSGGIRFEVCLPPSDQRETPFFFTLDSDSLTNNQPFSSAIPFIHQTQGSLECHPSMIKEFLKYFW